MKRGISKFVGLLLLSYPLYEERDEDWNENHRFPPVPHMDCVGSRL